MRSTLFLFIALSCLSLASCDFGLENAPMTGSYTFEEVRIYPMEHGDKGEVVKAKVEAKGKGVMKYMGDVSVDLTQEMDMTLFTLSNKFVVKDKDGNTITYAGSANLLPKDDQGNFFFSGKEDLISATGKFENASGLSTSQGEIFVAGKVTLVHKGLLSYSAK